ncbi:10090_t:CDS:10, partial [Entrophospora sp. SA101]
HKPYWEQQPSDITKPQEPFQPCSTPSKNNRRYLVLNNVGSINSTKNDSYSMINVEFHNKTQNRGYNLHDDFNYSMACLNFQGALFAVGSSKDSPSVLFFKSQNTWAIKNEWMTTFPKDEVIIGIALSSLAIIVATSKNFIRLFTLSGVQLYIFALDSVVCMDAYQEFALIVYHLGTGYRGSQNLGYMLYNVETNDIVQKEQLPISKDSTLEWIGFSDKGLPAMYDSEGVLSILHRHRQYHQARWIPVLYTRNNPNPDDEASYYWPVGLNENKFLCIACKDGERMPRYPRQKFHEFDWQIPLLNLDKPIGKTEEVYARMNLLIKFECDEIRAKKKSIDEEKQKELVKKHLELDKMLLTTIRTSCKESRLQHALDLAKLLNSTKSLESAIKIASFYESHSLAEKIHKLKSTCISDIRELTEADYVEIR